MAILWLWLASTAAFAQQAGNEDAFAVETPDLEKDYYGVTIADPFVDMHTGPGAAYPQFYIVERGEEVRIIRRKTNWFKIETRSGQTGWVSREQMRQTLTPSGETFQLIDRDEDDFEKRKWVFGVTGGEFESAPVFSFFGGYAFSENLSAEAHYGQSVGTVSSSRYLKGNLLLQPLPDLGYSPYFTLGAGRIETETSSTLIAAESDTSDFAQVGLGIQTYVSRSFLFRLEWNEYVIFSADSTRNDNEVIEEWKIGFAVFY